jgi:hypothetical protein
MSRGPFQGNWQQNARPTVVTAPDAVVYINGETDVIGCSSCRRKFDFNKYITSVQVDLSVESVPGSANISLSIPRHAIEDFYFDGVPILTPMMEIEIYAKGYYLVEGIPQYYPIFWGMIGDVSDNYSSGEHTVSISCHDILKWWEICKMNVNPAYTGATGQQGRSIFGNVFFGKNPYDVIWSLAQQSFGDAIIGTGSLINLRQESRQTETFNAALSDIMLYWTQRFRKIRSNLMLYGTNGVAVRGDTLWETYQKSGKNKPGNFAASAVAVSNGGADGAQMVFAPTDPEVAAFRTQFSQAGQVNFWQNEYQTKLELANAAKEAIGFEFYMDVTGDIVFKPPFYNLDVLQNKPISWIQDIDIIDWNLSESEAEVITQLTLQGSFGGNIEFGFSEEATPFTSVTDYHLLRKYGWRADTYNSEFMGSPLLMFYHGLDILDRKNSRRHRGSVSIPLRPELRLGFPIYLAPKDQIWYITGISHSIQFGGRAQTTLTLSARRQKFIAPKGIGQIEHTGFAKGQTVLTHPGNAAFKYSSRTLSDSGIFKLKVGDAASIPPVNADFDGARSGQNPYEPLILRHPTTGRLVGYPNVVMVYTRPFSTSPPDLAKLKGEKKVGTNAYTNAGLKQSVTAAGTKYNDQASKMLAAADTDGFISKSYGNRYQYGLNSAGVYTYAYEKTQTIGEIVLMPKTHLETVDAAGTKKTILEGSSAMIRPVSDERGFEVIGHFRYGRGVGLRDGQLLTVEGKVNERAHVDTQLALGGELYETLQSQSQGLTTVTTTYPNPVQAIIDLEPEDLQTAGFVNPETGKAKFISTGSNLYDSAPVGSPQQTGLTSSVEAGQLSRALTIVELVAKDEFGHATDDQNCACMLGRSDLAFISVGYKFKAINPTDPAETKMYSSAGNSSATTVSGGNAASSALGVAIASEIFNVDIATNPPTGKDLLARIDTYLTQVYSSSDDLHQAHEELLRTGGLPMTQAEQTGDLGAQPTTFGDLTPPFSAPDRYALGDTSAIVGDISSAAGDVSKAWSTFGKKLQSNAATSKTTQELSVDKADLASLQAERANLVASKGSKSVQISLFGSIDDQIARLDKQIADKQQKISQDELALAQAQNG